MRRVLFFLLFSNLYCGAVAQNTKIDSLWRVLKKTNNDSSRVNLLDELSYQYENYKPDTALILAHHGLMIAKKIDYASGETACLNMIGLVFMTTGNYLRALEYLLQSLKGSEVLHDESSVAACV